MISRLGIAIVLSLTMLAGPAWAGVCGASWTQPLVDCVVRSAEKDYPDRPDFNELYQVRNKCGYEVDVVVKLSAGDDVRFRLGNSEQKEEILPQSVEVTGFHCCSSSLNCEIPE